MINLNKLRTTAIIEIYKSCLVENGFEYTESAYILHRDDKNSNTKITLMDALSDVKLLSICKQYHSHEIGIVLVEYDMKVKKSQHVIDLINHHCAINAKMPIQPIHKYRFVPNRIVEALLETSSLDLNSIMCMDFTDNERIQFAQLIGYSVSGFGDLSYVDSMTANVTQKMAEGDTDNVKDIEIKILTNKLNNIQRQLRCVVEEVFDVDGDNFDEKW